MNGLLHSIVDWALAALGTYGYAIVFVSTICENVFLLGSIVPGDVVVAAAAFTATTAAGRGLSPWALIAVAAVGTLIGSNVSYLIGRAGGRELMERVGPRFGVGASAIDAGEEYFELHGSPTIVFARFVAVLKNLAPTIAGASRMNLFWFEVYSLVGALGYACILVAVGWFFGANFRTGLRYMGAFSWLVLAVVAIVAVVLWRAKRSHDRALLEELDAEFDAEHGLPHPHDGHDARDDGPGGTHDEAR